MSSGDRARRVRTLAADFGRHAGVDVTAVFDGDRWRLEWTNGPTEAAARAWVGARAPELAGVVSVDREYSRRAWAVVAVRMATDGAFWDGHVRLLPHEARWLVERALRDRERPDRVDGEREDLVARLLAEVPADPWGDGGELAGAVAERGLSWLLDGVDPGGWTPGEVLTSRYADTRAEVVAWERTLDVLPARVLVERALTDPGLDREGGLALVSLVPVLRAQADATEAAILAAAGRVATGTAIGERLGMTRQAVSLRLRAAEKAATDG